MKTPKITSKKINLGCGGKYKEGWINLDIGNTNVYGEPIKVDFIWDLNKFPYPFKDNSFDQALIEHTLEHLDDPLKVTKELVRITMGGGEIKIIVPHFSDRNAFTDITHKHFFSKESIRSILGYAGLLDKVEIKSKKIIFSDNRILSILNPLFDKNWNIYERFFHGWIPVQACEYVLRVVK